jgi:hypothetical protein
MDQQTPPQMNTDNTDLSELIAVDIDSCRFQIRVHLWSLLLDHTGYSEMVLT